MNKKENKPWYAGEHQDALFYLLIAIFFLEMIIGGVAFFYGIIHAEPEAAGGPPIARFPWLAWAVAASLAPVGLLLIVHLAGTLVSRALTQDGNAEKNIGDDKDLPQAMRRFYASVRHAPLIVILIAILLLGMALFFIDGAFASLLGLGHALLPYLPWIAGSLGAVLAICFIAHAFLVYRQRKLEQEYAWRREVLEKTGMVLVDKASVALPVDATQAALISPENGVKSIGVLDVSSRELPPGDEGNLEK